MASPTSVAGKQRNYVQGNIRGFQDTVTGASFADGVIWSVPFRIVETADAYFTGSGDKAVTYATTITNPTGQGGASTVTFNVSATPNNNVILEAFGY